MPSYRMSFEKCVEVFSGDVRYRNEQRTFEADSDEEATKQAEEIAGKEINISNSSITYRLEEWRQIGIFSKSEKSKAIA